MKIGTARFNLPYSCLQHTVIGVTSSRSHSPALTRSNDESRTLFCTANLRILVIYPRYSNDDP